MKDSNIFREEALNKKTQAEKLDAMLPVTRPAYWWAVFAAIVVFLVLVFWIFFGYINTTTVSANSFYYTNGYSNSYVSNQSGIITTIIKNSGQIVKKGEPVYLYDDKITGQNKEVVAPVSGLIIKNCLFPGSCFDIGEDLFTIRTFTMNYNGQEVLYDEKPELMPDFSYYNFEKKVYLFVSVSDISNIKEGQEVIVKSNSTSNGVSIRGNISKVGTYLVSQKEMKSLFGLEYLGSATTQFADSILCECSINEDPRKIKLSEGDLLSATIISGKVHPINLLFG